MKAKLTKILALVLASMMTVSALAGCGKQPEGSEVTSAADVSATDVDTYQGADTLVVGYANFSEKFSPFFADSAYDQDVASMVSVGLLGNDRGGNIILNGIEGETNNYNGTDYLYTGIADCEIVENSDGTVDYNFELRDDIVFSDGDDLTIDDVIFNMYVLADPTYDGSSTFYALPIEGLEEYRAGMDTLANLIIAAEPGNVSEFATEEQTAYYWNAFLTGGTNFAQEIVDYCMANYADYGAVDVTTSAALWGYELPEGATTEDFFGAMVDTYGIDLSDNGINYETAGTSISAFITEALGDRADEFAAGISTSESAPNISGIKKTGDNTMTVSLTEVDATAIYQLAVSVAPMHYYGDVAKYDYDNNMFGFDKGDLSSIKEKTTQPLGAGAYKFVSYENGVVTFEKNDLYYNGAPKITNILFQEVSEADKMTGVATGSLDISDPSISEDVVDSIKTYNGNDELTGPVITTNTVDNLGYGYIGICAKTVNVGGESDSDASKNLRKAFATLFSAYRDTVINSYYGERASVIQYPISNTSWAAPKPSDEGYQIAYSVDVDGNSIYTDSMNDEERYAAALEAAVGFLKAAGYTWDDAAGKFTAAPEGASLTYEFTIPADGVGDHPVFGIATAASAALAEVGIDLQVTDLSDSSILWDALDANTCEIWAAAWGATIDPDMYQIYHSSNCAGLEGSTNSNHYCITDAQLDELIMAARSSTDQSFRKATYKQCLDLILDWACEIPTYQRQNCIIFSSERVNMETVTPDITTFWGWMNDIELLEMNPEA